MSVDLSGLQAKLAKVGAEPLKKIREDAAHAAARELAGLVTVDMILGGGKGKNHTAFLRIQTQNLFNSYTQTGREDHIEQVTIDGMNSTLTFGSRAMSPGGFPYALAHELGGTFYPPRAHLAHGIADFKARGLNVVYAEQMAVDIVEYLVAA